MKKRLWLGGALFLASFLLLSGCGKKYKEVSASEGVSSSQETEAIHIEREEDGKEQRRSL